MLCFTHFFQLKTYKPQIKQQHRWQKPEEKTARFGHVGIIVNMYAHSPVETVDLHIGVPTPLLWGSWPGPGWVVRAEGRIGGGENGFLGGKKIIPLNLYGN